MSIAVKKICIISTRHISYNPRVLKEADALYCSGYKVVVVTVNNHNLQSMFDEELMKERSWSLITVNFRRSVKREKLKWLILSFQNKIYNQLKKISLRNDIAEKAAEKAYSSLKKLAINEKADLYIVHHAEALGIGFHAAKKNNSKWGFDAEDFHTGMNKADEPSDKDFIIPFLEEKYLPTANYITAASKGIAEAYKKKYRLSQKINVILNVFPHEQLSATSVASPVKFYWYSQVIGPTRNLEQLMLAAGKLKGSFELHFRGSFHNEEYKLLLLKLAAEYGLENNIFFHEPIMAERLIIDASQFDIGLALESDVSINRNVCVTNKIFCYLMAGLAIVGTDTMGQKDIFTHFPGAVKECKMNDEVDLAIAMQYFIDHPGQLAMAKKTARGAAEQQFNWECESKKFLMTIQNVLTDQ